MHHDLAPKIKFDCGEFRTIAIYAKNREEWTLTDLGCAMTNVTTVTLYDTLGKESIEYILDQTQIKTVVCSGDKLKNLLDIRQTNKIQTVTHIMYFDEEASMEMKERAKECGVELVWYSDVILEGLKLEAKLEEVTGESLYTVCYTSGTTGMPKGGMLSQGNYLSNVGAVEFLDGVFALQQDDVYISYLPLAHVFERFFMLACLSYGV